MSASTLPGFASPWVCPSCWAEGEAGTDLLVFDDADAGVERPWLFIRCLHHDVTLLGLPFDDRLLALVPGAA